VPREAFLEASPWTAWTSFDDSHTVPGTDAAVLRQAVVVALDPRGGGRATFDAGGLDKAPCPAAHPRCRTQRLLLGDELSADNSRQVDGLLAVNLSLIQ